MALDVMRGGQSLGHMVHACDREVEDRFGAQVVAEIEPFWRRLTPLNVRSHMVQRFGFMRLRQMPNMQQG